MFWQMKDVVAWAKSSKIRWAVHVIRFAEPRWTRAVTDWTQPGVKRTPDSTFVGMFGKLPERKAWWCSLLNDEDPVNYSGTWYGLNRGVRMDYTGTLSRYIGATADTQMI